MSAKNLMLQASPELLAYLDRLARERNLKSRASVIDHLVAEAGRSAGLGDPPPRANPVGTNRFTAGG